MLPTLATSICTSTSRAVCMRTAPSGHPESQSRSAELAHLKAKIDAGADYIITQVRHLPNCAVSGRLPRRSTFQLCDGLVGLHCSCVVIGHVCSQHKCLVENSPRCFSRLQTIPITCESAALQVPSLA